MAQYKSSRFLLPTPQRLRGNAVFINDSVVVATNPAVGDTIDFLVPKGLEVSSLTMTNTALFGTAMAAQVGFYPVDPDSPIEYTRSSNATMFDSQGRLVWAPANMAVNSVAAGAVAPNTSPTGWTIASGAAGLSAQIIATGESLINGSNYVDVRFYGTNSSGGMGYPYIRVASVSGLPGESYSGAANVQLLNDVVGNFYSGTSPRAQIQALSGSAYISTIAEYVYNSTTQKANGNRVAIPSTAAALATTSQIVLYPLTMFVANAVAVDFTVRVWAPQLERNGVDSAKPYIPTTSAAVYGPRFVYNPATRTALELLIEEARTNYWKYTDDPSQTYWEAQGTPAPTKSTGVVDPFGTTTAVTLNFAGTVSGRLNSLAGLAIPAASVITLSMWVKANSAGNLGVGAMLDGVTPTWAAVPVTTSWTRVSYTWAQSTASVNTVYVAHSINKTCGDLVSICRPQIEVGAFATSLIPTFGSTATRAADMAIGQNYFVGGSATTAIGGSAGGRSFYFAPITFEEDCYLRVKVTTAGLSLTPGTIAVAIGGNQTGLK